MVGFPTRRIHPTTGAKIEYDDAEKKDLILVEGGEDMQNLFKHVGLVVDTDTYEEAVEKVRTALKKRGNRTSAVYKLFNGHPQGGQSFEAWHREVFKAAKLIDWAGYDHNKAAVDAIITQTSSAKLRQRAIQENPDYTALVDLGISQEQAKKKSSKLPDGEAEVVNRLKQENKKLKNKLKSGSGAGGKEGSTDKRCEKCCIAKCKGGTSCFAEGKKCIKCGGLSHFQASKLCPEKNSKQATARKLEEAEGSDSEGSEESCGRIMEDSISVGKVEAKKKNSILCKLQVTGPVENQNWAKISLATDTGVRKTILRRSDWERINVLCPEEILNCINHFSLSCRVCMQSFPVNSWIVQVSKNQSWRS